MGNGCCIKCECKTFKRDYKKEKKGTGLVCHCGHTYASHHGGYETYSSIDDSNHPDTDDRQ